MNTCITVIQGIHLACTTSDSSQMLCVSLFIAGAQFRVNSFEKVDGYKDKLTCNEQ